MDITPVMFGREVKNGLYFGQTLICFKSDFLLCLVKNEADDPGQNKTLATCGRRKSNPTGNSSYHTSSKHKGTKFILAEYRTKNKQK